MNAFSKKYEMKVFSLLIWAIKSPGSCVVKQRACVSVLLDEVNVCIYVQLFYKMKHAFNDY